MRFLVSALVVSLFMIPASAEPRSGTERTVNFCRFSGELVACPTAGAVSFLCLHQENFAHDLPVFCVGDMVATCAAAFGNTVTVTAFPDATMSGTSFEIHKLDESSPLDPNLNLCFLSGELADDAEFQFYLLSSKFSVEPLEVFCSENTPNCDTCVGQNVHQQNLVVMQGPDPLFITSQSDC